MKLMNCTPHAVTVQDFVTKVAFEIPCSGTVVRTRTNSVFDKVVDLPSRRCIAVNSSKGINITNLPDEQDDVMLILSAVAAADVKLMHPERNDIYSPDELFRGISGKIIYCKAFMRW